MPDDAKAPRSGDVDPSMVYAFELIGWKSTSTRDDMRRPLAMAECKLQAAMLA